MVKERGRQDTQAQDRLWGRGDALAAGYVSWGMRVGTTEEWLGVGSGSVALYRKARSQVSWLQSVGAG